MKCLKINEFAYLLLPVTANSTVYRKRLLLRSFNWYAGIFRDNLIESNRVGL